MKKKITLEYYSLQFTYWMANAAILSFASAFLLPQGFTSSEIGILMCFGNVLTLMGQPLLANYADRSRRFTAANILEITSLVLMGIVGTLFFLQGKKTAIFVMFILALLGHNVMQPMVNAMNFKFEANGIKINYGFARSMGSLGYSLVSAILGFLVEKYGALAIPASAEVVIAIALLCIFLLGNDSKKLNDAVAEKKEEPKGKSLPEFIKSNKKLVLVNIAGALLMFGAFVYGTYLLQILQHVGGTEKDMGLGLSIAAVCEVPTMLLFDKLKEKFSVGGLLKAGALGYIVKNLIFLLSGSAKVMLLGQVAQAFSFALIMPGIVAYNHENSAPEDQNTAQSIFPMLSSTMGLGVSLLGGFMIDLVGTTALIITSTVVAGLGASMMFVMTKK